MPDWKVALYLASDHASAVLEARQALFGEASEANGVAVTSLAGLFER